MLKVVSCTYSILYTLSFNGKPSHITLVVYDFLELRYTREKWLTLNKSLFRGTTIHYGNGKVFEPVNTCKSRKAQRLPTARLVYLYCWSILCNWYAPRRRFFISSKARVMSSAYPIQSICCSPAVVLFNCDADCGILYCKRRNSIHLVLHRFKNTRMT